MDFKKHAEKLFMNSELADVTFTVDGEEIPGHRLVLALSCPYFKVMLHGGLPESQSRVIKLTSTPAKQFKEVLRYCYLGKTEVTDWKVDELLALLALAHEYQFDDLVTHVAIALEKQPLDFGHWDIMHATATTLDLEILKSKCKAFAEKKVDSFLGVENVQLFSTSLVNSLLETTKAATVDQTKLLKAISQWKSDKTAAEIRSALSKLNWEKVSPKVMASIVKEVIHEVDLSGLKFWDDVFQGDYQAATCSGQKAIQVDLLPSKIEYSKSLFENAQQSVNTSGQVVQKCTTNLKMPKGSIIVFSKDKMNLIRGKERKFLCNDSAANILWKFETWKVTFGFVNAEYKMTGFKWDSYTTLGVLKVEICGKCGVKAREIASDDQWTTYSVRLPTTTSMDRICIEFEAVPHFMYIKLRNVEVFGKLSASTSMWNLSAL